MPTGTRARSLREPAALAPMLGAVLVAAAILHPLDARAHAVLDTTTAVAGAYHKLVVRIGHGCAGSPTVEVTVELPDGVGGGRPQPKPGWQVAVAREPLAEPFRDAHGNEVKDRVARITWSDGRLEDWQFEEFAISIRLPNKPGETLRFPVIQRCREGEHRWVEVPQPGQRPGALREPAPALFLLPRQ